MPEGLSGSVLCPHCGEPTDTFVDPAGGAHQDYVEDCVVCCRPIHFIAVYSDEDQDFQLDARAE